MLRERERGFGTEYYVESMYVQILEMDDERVALAADPGAPVVLSTDTLTEGSAGPALVKYFSNKNKFHKSACAHINDLEYIHRIYVM